MHSTKDSVTIVYATNDHRALTRAIAVSVVNVLLIEGSCLRLWLKTPSDDTSDMISKRQLLVDGDAEASNSAEKIDSWSIHLLWKRTCDFAY